MNNSVVIIPQEDLKPLFKDIIRELLEESAGLTIPSAPTGTIEQPLTQTELCQFLGVSVPTVIRWRKKGKIPFMTVGSAVRFDRAAVLKALESKRR